jgi:hypothetical protein
MSHIADVAKKELADRGKDAEGKCRQFLKVVGESDAKFDWQRQYDARASRGRIPSQTGDFEWFATGRHGVIEVKETEHDYRLAKKPFQRKDGSLKFGVLKKRALAGGEITILVYHSTLKLWRVPDLQYFLDRITQPSWDLREFRTFETVAAALYFRGLQALR